MQASPEEYTDRDWLELIYKVSQDNYRETKRIRNNVVFFFWMFILSIGWAIILLLFGGPATLVSLGSI